MASKWNVFDPQAEVSRSSRNLPHWDQPTALTFVTMRLADSMPREIVRLWQEEIETWLDKHGLANRSVDDILSDPAVTAKLKFDLIRFKHRRWHNHLDNCHGECVFRDSVIAAEVGKTLLHFNGLRYDIERFIVMPNHVHLLIQMRTGFDMRAELTGLMRYSARSINRQRGVRGTFWQPEPFDHIVRSEEQFRYLQDYILQNPAKAKLRTGEFLFWKCVEH
ncbi:MAG: transposase [Pirellulaceae bacterium]